MPPTIGPKMSAANTNSRTAAALEPLVLYRNWNDLQEKWKGWLWTKIASDDEGFLCCPNRKLTSSLQRERERAQKKWKTKWTAPGRAYTPFQSWSLYKFTSERYRFISSSTEHNTTPNSPTWKWVSESHTDPHNPKLIQFLLTVHHRCRPPRRGFGRWIPGLPRSGLPCPGLPRPGLPESLLRLREFHFAALHSF